MQNVRQYIGEIYFQRAWKYFGKLQTFGDFPIVTKTRCRMKRTVDRSEQASAAE